MSQAFRNARQLRSKPRILDAQGTLPYQPCGGCHSVLAIHRRLSHEYGGDEQCASTGGQYDDGHRVHGPQYRSGRSQLVDLSRTEVIRVVTVFRPFGLAPRQVFRATSAMCELALQDGIVRRELTSAKIGMLGAC